MKTVHFLRMLAGALVPLGGLMAATPAGADLILDFDNARPDASTLLAYITLTGAPAVSFNATIAGTGVALQEGRGDSLSTPGAEVRCHQLHVRPELWVSGLTFTTGLSAANN